MNKLIDFYRRALAKISINIILQPELINSLTKEVIKSVEDMGLRAFIRADGYAIMKNDTVGRIGLPHLRYTIMGDRVSVWVRDSFRLSKELLSLSGFRLEEYCQEILAVANKIAELFKKYENKSSWFSIELP